MPEMTWGKINDFKPGIYHTVAPNHKPGCAQEDKTFRCHASENGSLVPLPKMVDTITITPPTIAPEDGSGDDALINEEYRIIGLMVNNPVFNPAEPVAGRYQNNSEIWVGFEWWDTGGLTGDDRLNMNVQRYLIDFGITPAWEDIAERSYTQEYDERTRPRKMEFCTMRSNSADPNVGGPVVVAWVASGWAQTFPNDTTPTVSSTRFLPGDNVDDVSAALIGVDGFVSHQGRLVIFPLLVLGMGDDQLYTTNEAFYWTPVNDLSQVDTSIAVGGFLNPIGSYDNPTGYQIYQSLTADELLLIKSRGGAIVISGNLNDHQITTKQNVRGTGLSMNRGTTSPRGFLYPVDGGGVWIWEGGDISTHLTPHLDEDFWRPPPYSPARAAQTVENENQWGFQNSQCADWNEFVLFPNNWLFETDFNGWWKLDNPARFIIHRWAVDWRGIHAYGAPSGFTDSNDPVLYQYNRVIPADSMSWQSHPMPETYEDRGLEVREIVLVASGAGTVTVTPRTAQNQTGQSIEFTIDEDYSPNVISASVSVIGSHLTFEIQSQGTDTDTPAPEIHELRYGYIASQQNVRVAIEPVTYAAMT